jgi:hypothetical protein
MNRQRQILKGQFRKWSKAIVVLIAISSCKLTEKEYDPCVPELERGQVYRIVLQELYEPGTKTVLYDASLIDAVQHQRSNRCEKSFDLFPNSAINFTVSNVENFPPCQRATGVILSVSNLAIGEKREVSSGGPVELGSYHVALSPTCSGVWVISFWKLEAKNPFASTDPLKPPTVLMYRRFTSDEGSICLTAFNEIERESKSCEDYFVATITEQQ